LAKCWRKHLVQQACRETFNFSTDPEFVGKVAALTGFYPSSPRNAIVLCVNEQFQIKTLDRPAAAHARGPIGECKQRLRTPWHHHPVRRT
jgi:hypothetical protein